MAPPLVGERKVPLVRVISFHWCLAPLGSAAFHRHLDVFKACLLFTHIHSLTHTYAHKHTHARTHTRTHTHTFTCTPYTSTHTCTCTHTLSTLKLLCLLKCA